MDAGEAWGQAFQRLRQRNQNGKIADTIVKANPQILQSMGMAPEEFEGLSAEDKSAKVQGVFEAQGYQKAMADIQRLQKLGEVQDFEMDTARKDATARQGFADRMKGYFNMPETIRRPDAARYGTEELLGSGMNPRSAAEYSRLLEGMGAVQPGSVKDLSGSGLGGYAFVTLGREGSGTVVPTQPRGTAVKPAKAQAPNESWVYSEDPEEFRKGLLKVSDPAVRDAVLAARRSYNLAQGKGESEMGQLLQQMMGGGKKEESSSGSSGVKVRKWDPKTKRFQ